MKKIILLLMLFSFIQNGIAQNEILGKWLAPEEDGIMTVFKKGNKSFGRLTWAKETVDQNGKPLLDKQNPDPSLRDRAILNMVILENAIYEDGEWVNGTIYHAEEGKTYECTLWMENGKLQLRGYWGWFFKTATWTRAK